MQSTLAVPRATTNANCTIRIAMQRVQGLRGFTHLSPAFLEFFLCFIGAVPAHQIQIWALHELHNFPRRDLETAATASDISDLGVRFCPERSPELRWPGDSQRGSPRNRFTEKRQISQRSSNSQFFSQMALQRCNVNFLVRFLG